MDLPRAALMPYGRVCPVRSPALISNRPHDGAAIDRASLNGTHAKAAE
jgi:hypothetical protein